MKPALTVKQVAELLNINERTVYRMVQQGELPGFRVANSWRFLEEDIRSWIDGQKSVALRNSKAEADAEEAKP